MIVNATHTEHRIRERFIRGVFAIRDNREVALPRCVIAKIKCSRIWARETIVSIAGPLLIHPLGSWIYTRGRKQGVKVLGHRKTKKWS